ncbi:hypothetical protein GGF31_001143 [Allomyces arbusculus]|nr:hypothetical protein GGF31_001143 [Allomyces arbusculus]
MADTTLPVDAVPSDAAPVAEPLLSAPVEDVAPVLAPSVPAFSTVAPSDQARTPILSVVPQTLHRVLVDAPEYLAVRAVIEVRSERLVNAHGFAATEATLYLRYRARRAYEDFRDGLLYAEEDYESSNDMVSLLKAVTVADEQASYLGFGIPNCDQLDQYATEYLHHVHYPDAPFVNRLLFTRSFEYLFQEIAKNVSENFHRMFRYAAGRCINPFAVLVESWPPPVPPRDQRAAEPPANRRMRCDFYAAIDKWVMTICRRGSKLQLDKFLYKCACIIVDYNLFISQNLKYARATSGLVPDLGVLHVPVPFVPPPPAAADDQAQGQVEQQDIVHLPRFIPEGVRIAAETLPRNRHARHKQGKAWIAPAGIDSHAFQQLAKEVHAREQGSSRQDEATPLPPASCTSGVDGPRDQDVAMGERASHEEQHGHNGQANDAAAHRDATREEDVAMYKGDSRADAEPRVSIAVPAARPDEPASAGSHDDDVPMCEGDSRAGARGDKDEDTFTDDADAPVGALRLVPAATPAVEPDEPVPTRSLGDGGPCDKDVHVDNAASCASAGDDSHEDLPSQGRGEQDAPSGGDATPATPLPGATPGKSPPVDLCLVYRDYDKIKDDVKELVLGLTDMFRHCHRKPTRPQNILFAIVDFVHARRRHVRLDSRDITSGLLADFPGNSPDLLHVVFGLIMKHAHLDSLVPGARDPNVPDEQYELALEHPVLSGYWQTPRVDGAPRVGSSFTTNGYAAHILISRVPTDDDVRRVGGEGEIKQKSTRRVVTRGPGRAVAAKSLHSRLGTGEFAAIKSRSLIVSDYPKGLIAVDPGQSTLMTTTTLTPFRVGAFANGWINIKWEITRHRNPGYKSWSIPGPRWSAATGQRNQTLQILRLRQHQSDLEQIESRLPDVHDPTLAGIIALAKAVTTNMERILGFKMDRRYAKYDLQVTIAKQRALAYLRNKFTGYGILFGNKGAVQINRVTRMPVKGVIRYLLVYGVDVLLVDEHNTSKLCAVCGSKFEATSAMKVNRKFAYRYLRCPSCKYVVNRDVNATWNMFRVGLRDVFDIYVADSMLKHPLALLPSRNAPRPLLPQPGDDDFDDSAHDRYSGNHGGPGGDGGDGGGLRGRGSAPCGVSVLFHQPLTDLFGTDLRVNMLPLLQYEHIDASALIYPNVNPAYKNMYQVVSARLVLAPDLIVFCGPKIPMGFRSTRFTDPGGPYSTPCLTKHDCVDMIQVCLSSAPLF